MVVIALGLVAATALAAEARDLCMDFSNGGTLVMKRFRIPRPNRCAPVHAFEVGGGRSVVTGSACTSAAGTMNLHYTAHAGYDHYFESARCHVYLPLAPTGPNGSCLGQYITAAGAQDGFNQTVTLRSCDVDVPFF